MRLLLTSQGTVNKVVRNKLVELVNTEPNQCNLLFITTAANPIEKPSYMYRELESLKKLGFKINKFDLLGKSKKEVEKEVDKSNVVFVIGGEPFFLLKEVRKSGFDRIIKKLNNDKLYVGASAGTYIACPSVEMGLWKKPNRNTYGIKDFTGMGLVDFMVVAHYEEKYKQLIQRKSKETPYKIYPLTDKQAISVVKGKLGFVNF